MTVLMIAGLVIITSPANAVQHVLTDDEIQQIRDTCVGAQSVLQELHNADALLRVNLGQQYETISSDLMIPLNNRLASNKIDASSLTSITTQYTDALKLYKETSHAYYSLLEETKDMDCKAQPVEFYRDIESLREYRVTLGGQVMSINKLSLDYQAAFRKVKNGQLDTAN